MEKNAWEVETKRVLQQAARESEILLLGMDILKSMAEGELGPAWLRQAQGLWEMEERWEWEDRVEWDNVGEE